MRLLISNYNGLDSFPSNGNNFYRLKETDIDGLFKYSNVIRIQVTSKPFVTISPNPAVNYFDVAISSAVSQNVTILLTDLNGKTLMAKNIQLTKGNNIITINVNNLSKGIYVLRSTDLGFVQKILKQ